MSFVDGYKKFVQLATNLSMILIAVVWAIIVICICLDKIFNLRWGYEWVHLLYVLLIGAGLLALHLFSKLISYIAEKTKL